MRSRCLRLMCLISLVSCGRVGFDIPPGVTDVDAGVADASVQELCSGDRLSNAPYAAGTGARDDPYRICTPDQLQALSQRPGDWGAAFVLMADLDLGVLAAGLSPIGGIETPFVGRFDGGGHELAALLLNDQPVDGESRQMRGLFGRLGAGGEILRLGLHDVTFGSLAHNQVGALCGSVDAGARIAEVYLTGADLVVTQDELRRIGGLVGENFGTIEDCFATAALQVVASTADPENRTSVASIVGANAGLVRRCYATGAIATNAARVAAVVGRNRVFTTEFVPGTLRDSFAMSPVSGVSGQCHHIGPVIGGGVNNTHENLFYDQDVTCSNDDPGCTSCDFSDGQTGVDLSASPEYFATPTNPPLDQWDFQMVWATVPGRATPVFRWMLE